MVSIYSAGTVTVANTYTTGTQLDAKIVTHPGGGYTVVWQSNGQDGSGFGIYSQRFDSTGAKVGSEIRVNAYTTSDQNAPVVTRLSDGDYVVAWASNGQDGAGAGIYAQRFNPDGTTQGSEFRVNTTTAGNQGWTTLEPLSGLAVTDLGANGFVVTWQGNGAQTGQVDTMGIFAQCYDLSGAAVGGEVRVNTTTTNDQTVPAVDAFSNGSYVVSWTSLAQDGSGYGVYAQRFDASGVAVGSETRINSYTASDQLMPSVAVLADDSYVIAWYSNGQDGDGLGVYAQRYDSSGAAIGSEFRVNTYTTSDQNYPRVTAMSDGGFVIGWTSKNQDFANATLPHGAYSQRYDSGGNTVGFETLVNETVVGSQVHPVTAELDDGNVVTAWVNYASSYGDIHQQVYEHHTDGYGGNAVLGAGAVTRVNSYTNNSQLDAKIVTHPDGEYSVIWQSNGQDGSGIAIASQRYDASGTKLGAETRVNTYTTGDQNAPAVTRLSDDGYVVTWVSNGQDGSGAGIYAQRFNADGTMNGAEFRVNTTTTSNQGWATAEPLSGVAIADLGTNGFVVTWQGVGTQSGQADTIGIFAQRYDMSGAAVGGEVRVNTTTTGDQTVPAVDGFSDGGYVISWTSAAQDGSGLGVYAQRFDANGVAVGSETRVNTYTTSDQVMPSVAVLADDSYVISWYSTGQDGSGLGVYAQRYDASGTALGSEFRVNTFTTNDQNYPRITALADGGFIIAWTSKNQDAGGTYPHGAYMQRYDASGNAVGGETRINQTTAESQVHPVVAELDNGNIVTTWVHIQSTSVDVYQQVFTNTAGFESYYGTASAETIDGGIGEDTVLGGGGNDTLWGSAGHDSMSGDNGDDIVDGGGDNDTLYGVNGDDNLTGGWGADALYGGAGLDTLAGNTGNDTLDGGVGADTLTGGTGNDAYYVDDLDDVLVEAAGEGIDTIYATFALDLRSLVHFENLTVTPTDTSNDTFWGNDGGNTIVANSGANVMYGGDGNDVLHGYIGADTLYGEGGDDTMIGLSQDDVYYVDSTGDVAQETLAAHGYDIVYASATFDLGDYIEELNLTGTANIDGHANEGNNLMRGNSGNNGIYGNGGNDTIDGGAGVDTMYGGTGGDYYIVDNVADHVWENLIDGSDTIYSYVDYTLINGNDHLILANDYGDLTGIGNGVLNDITGNNGNNYLFGDDGKDTLRGGAGNDTLDGGLQTDTMYGSTGDDIYYVGTGGSGVDIVIENLNEGTDLVYVTLNYGMTANVENLTQTGTAAMWANGNALDNIMIGNSGSSSLYGYDGNDWLDGGSGVDSLGGMKGNDTYVVDNLSDVIGELAGEGTDRVRSYVTWTLATNFENLTLTGTDTINGTGNSVANDMLGNVAANLLTSYDGNDTVDGGGGVDTLIGGIGDDLYRVDDAADIVTELSGEGADTIEATASYSLVGVDNIEALTLTGSGNINVTGNANGNVLNGNSGNNILDGGAGADTLTGGLGDDTYIIDDAGDVFTEAAGAGTDTVVINASHTLSANFENLTLTGTAALTGAGNSADNVITGNDGDNTLTGADGNDTLDGGLGVDSLVGGLGNDTYVIDNTGDVIVESAGEGTDTVRSYLSHTLSADFEHLTLLGTASDGTGNAGANAINGNASVNVLDGAAGADTLYGLDGNDTLIGGLDNDQMYGGLGNDVYYVDHAGDGVNESAAVNEGSDTVYAGISWNATANIEAIVLTGSGNTSSTGNSLANTITGTSGDNGLSGSGGNDTLSGGDGDDSLNGGSGADSLNGGVGNDVYYVDNVGDVVVEAASEGTDTVSSSISYTAAANIEAIVLSGSGNTSATGNGLDNTLSGNSGNNALSGGDGADTLSGGNGQDSLDGGVGGDALTGGAGNDAYVVDDAGDVIVETAGQGTDTVSSGIDYALTADVENLVLTGAALSGTGNSLANAITGTFGDNSLSGGDGNDTLDGGTGADSLTGGAGDDSYVVDNTGDVVVEASGEGTDTVSASVDYALTADVENLILTGAAANGTGNGLANTITGTSGNNVLDGGAGADTLTGGDGDDSYVVDDTGDVVVEASGEGSDTVTAAISYALAANVENLVLTGAAASGTGNGLDNVITGTGGNNALDGGAGADTLTGGDGDDSYFVDDAGDVVVEASGEGTDTVSASVDYALTADVENLILTGAALTGSGNGLDNVITGTADANVLTGGEGDDSLTGGADNDDFVFGDAAANGTDTITDFEQGVDRLVFTGADYGFAATYSLSASEFTIGTSAVGTNAQFIWDDTTGQLYWDADGTDSGTAIAIAEIVGSVTKDDLYFV